MYEIEIGDFRKQRTEKGTERVLSLDALRFAYVHEWFAPWRVSNRFVNALLTHFTRLLYRFLTPFDYRSNPVSERNIKEYKMSKADRETVLSNLVCSTSDAWLSEQNTDTRY